MDFQVGHAVFCLREKVKYGDECTVTVSNGLRMATPAYPSDCHYVRIVTPKGYEVAYWCVDEWESEGCSVMGAIMGCLNAPDWNVRDFENAVELKLAN